MQDEEEDDFAELLCDLGSLLADHRKDDSEAEAEAERLCVPLPPSPRRTRLQCRCTRDKRGIRVTAPLPPPRSHFRVTRQ